MNKSRGGKLSQVHFLCAEMYISKTYPNTDSFGKDLIDSGRMKGRESATTLITVNNFFIISTHAASMFQM